MNHIRTLHLVALTVLSLAAIPAMAAENYLLASHKQRLEKARFEESAAKSTWDKAFALRQQAAELDSMGKSAEALTVIDRALSLIKPEKDKDFIATKASILFSMNDPEVPWHCWRRNWRRHGSTPRARLPPGEPSRSEHSRRTL